MLALAAGAAGAGAVLWAGFALGAFGAPPAQALPAHAPSLCAAGERVVYSCAFPRGTGSVCAGHDRLHYRFGKAGHVDVDIVNAPDWSNVHTGTVVGQGGGSQSHIRFSSGQIHYIAFAGEMGALSDHPGRRWSGIAVQQGAKGEKTLATLDCKAGATLAADGLVGALAAFASGPSEEEQGGPFDAWF